MNHVTKQADANCWTNEAVIMLQTNQEMAQEEPSMSRAQLLKQTYEAEPNCWNKHLCRCQLLIKKTNWAQKPYSSQLPIMDSNTAWDGMTILNCNGVRSPSLDTPVWTWSFYSRSASGRELEHNPVWTWSFCSRSASGREPEHNSAEPKQREQIVWYFSWNQTARSNSAAATEFEKVQKLVKLFMSYA